MYTKLKNITLAILMMVSLAACKKGWLDVRSGTEIKSDDQFQSESGFKDALMGVYIGMTDPAMYSKDMTWSLVDILSHQYLAVSGSAQYADIYAYNYGSLKASTRIDAMWNKSYNVIANINNALTNIDKNKGVLDPLNYSLIKGELLGLRAMLHFDLLRIYGYGNVTGRPDASTRMAVPYTTEFKKEATTQLNYNKTFELLNKDISDALVLLKEDPAYNNPKKPASYYSNVNRDGFYNKREQRMNYYAVKALQARSLLWQGGSANLADAAAAAEEVIKDGPARLVSSAAAATGDPALYPEHLFNLNVTGFIDIINQYLNGENVANVDAIALTNAYAQSTYEISNPNIGLSDYRYNNLLSSQIKGMVSIKFFQKTFYYLSRNAMPLIKLPEMYYIASEQYITANPGKAVEYLNKVRQSRGITQDIPAGSDQVTLKAELEKEYQKEFVMEGQLFFYYKRLGKTTFPGLAVGALADDKLYMLPYPATEIELGGRVQ